MEFRPVQSPPGAGRATPSFTSTSMPISRAFWSMVATSWPRADLRSCVSKLCSKRAITSAVIERWFSPAADSRRFFRSRGILRFVWMSSRAIHKGYQAMCLQYIYHGARVALCYMALNEENRMENTRQMPQAHFRVPAEMKDWLRDRAQRNRRSANSELVAILDEIKSRETSGGARNEAGDSFSSADPA